jgi:callose synthase
VRFESFRKPRFYTGLLLATCSGFLAFTYLEPLFLPVGMNLAVVALWILTFDAAMVGMSLGVLLPMVVPGICFGLALALLIGSLSTLLQPLYFPVTALVLALIGAIISARYVVGWGLCSVRGDAGSKCP